MDINDFLRKHADDEKKKVSVFNPLNEDFICVYDKSGDAQEYTIPSKENKLFKTSLAKHIGGHLIDAYLNTKGLNYPRDKAVALIMA